MQGYAKAANVLGPSAILQLADALVMLERDRSRAQREAQAQRGAFLPEMPTTA
jgi:hypothetical protein